VAPGTFAALGIPLKRGRDFDDSDIYEAPFTAIVNETLARKSFPELDPVGRMIFGAYLPRPVKVVGVVGDVRQMAYQGPLPEIYLPYQQHPYWGMDLSIVVRTAGDPGRIAQAMRKKVRDLAPEVPVQFTTADASLSENIATPRFRTLLLGIFSALALCLAMAGVYGVVAYVVGRRLTEIGLRMALGASSGDMLWLVLREGLALAGVGLAVGLAGAVAATRLLTSMLFEVKPADPAILAGVAVLLAAMSLTASYIPARRATKVDPLVALRQE
jgi:predicted permease